MEVSVASSLDWQTLPLEILLRVATSSVECWLRCSQVFRRFGLATLETRWQEHATQIFYGTEWQANYVCSLCGLGGRQLWVDSQDICWWVADYLRCAECLRQAGVHVTVKSVTADVSFPVKLQSKQDGGYSFLRLASYTPAIPCYMLPGSRFKLVKKANRHAWRWWTSLDDRSTTATDRCALPQSIQSVTDIPWTGRLRRWLDKYTPIWKANASKRSAPQLLDEQASVTAERLFRELAQVTEEYGVRWVSRTEFDSRFATDIEPYEQSVDPFADFFRYSDAGVVKASLDKMRYFIAKQHKRYRGTGSLAPLDLSFVAHIRRNGTMYYRPRWRWYRDYTDAECTDYGRHLWLLHEKEQCALDAAFPRCDVLEKLLKTVSLKRHEETELRRFNRRQGGWTWQLPTKAFLEYPLTHSCMWWCSEGGAFLVFDIWSGNLEDKLKELNPNNAIVRATLTRDTLGLFKRVVAKCKGKDPFAIVLLWFQIQIPQ